MPGSFLVLALKVLYPGNSAIHNTQVYLAILNGKTIVINKMHFVSSRSTTKTKQRSIVDNPIAEVKWNSKNIQSIRKQKKSKKKQRTQLDIINICRTLQPLSVEYMISRIHTFT